MLHTVPGCEEEERGQGQGEGTGARTGTGVERTLPVRGGVEQAQMLHTVPGTCPL